MADIQPCFEGMCYYSGSRFVAQLNEKRIRFNRPTDEGVHEILRQGFEFLMSSDAERVVGGHPIKKKMVQRGQRQQPGISMNLGGTLYQMVQSRNGGAASLAVYLPFASSSAEFDIEDMTGDEDEGV